MWNTFNRIMLPYLLICGTVSAGEGLEGRWSARFEETATRLRFTIQDSTLESWRWTWLFQPGNLPGLESIGESHLRIERDAGTIEFSGTVVKDRGKGRFIFSPNRSFERMLKEMVVDDVTPEAMFLLSLADIAPETVDTLAAMGFSGFTAEDLARLALQNVTLSYIREIRSLGFQHLSLPQLIMFHIQGIDYKFFDEHRKMHDPDLSREMCIRLAVHGVTADYVKEVRQWAPWTVSLDRIIEFHIHGVTRQDIAQLEEEGYNDISVPALIKCRIHGVDPDYIAEIRGSGYSGLTLNQLIQFRIHEINSDYIEKALKSSNKQMLSPEEIIRLKIHDLIPGQSRTGADS